jgi:hypothetical protein
LLLIGITAAQYFATAYSEPSTYCQLQFPPEASDVLSAFIIIPQLIQMLLNYIVSSYSVQQNWKITLDLQVVNGKAIPVTSREGP